MVLLILTLLRPFPFPSTVDTHIPQSRPVTSIHFVQKQASVGEIQGRKILTAQEKFLRVSVQGNRQPGSGTKKKAHPCRYGSRKTRRMKEGVGMSMPKGEGWLLDAGTNTSSLRFEDYVPRAEDGWVICFKDVMVFHARLRWDEMLGCVSS